MARFSKIAPAYGLTTLHSFDYTDGSYILSSPVQDTNGGLYGTPIPGIERLWNSFQAFLWASLPL
ncbi:MAG: hypothetical protein ABSE57_13375 [Bryobacteraceae bacterium]